MKRFLKYCILFVLPILVAIIPLEVLIRQVPNPYKYKYEWMQANAKDVETIVLGSSHSFYGIRPEYLDGNAFSLANVSQDISHDLFLLKYWEGQYNSLKTVIFPVSYFTWFGKGLQYGTESYRCRYYKMYMDSDDYPTLSLNNLEIADFRTAKGKLKKLLKSEKDPGVDKYGWGNTYLLSRKDMIQWNDGSEAEAAILRHKAKSWDNILANYLKLGELADFCSSHDVRLILITFPCWSSYTDGLDPMQLEKMYEITNRFKKEYHVPYLDYLKDSRFEADDFFDSNHLSDVGAIKFTMILNQDIESLNN